MRPKSAVDGFEVGYAVDAAPRMVSLVAATHPEIDALEDDDLVAQGENFGRLARSFILSFTLLVACW